MIADFLLVIGDSITEQDQINVVLEGLPEEYSQFVVMICGSPDSPSTLSANKFCYLSAEFHFTKIKHVKINCYKKVISDYTVFFCTIAGPNSTLKKPSYKVRVSLFINSKLTFSLFNVGFGFFPVEIYPF